MPEEKELIEMVKRAYEERKTRDIRKEELIEWLKRNGLAPEQASVAIHLAIEQSIIRFCYPPSVGGDLVPSYERITEEDLLPREIVEEMRKKIVRKYRKATKNREKQRD
nr:hypothetical protein [Candidatus Njordarchaeota archaeon]